MNILPTHAGIYKFTNNVNGKVYIGQAQNIAKRHSTHRRSSLDLPLYGAFKKYGFNNFSFDILEVVSDLLDLDKREQYWIDFYQCFKKENGYNISPTAGSSRGTKRSKESMAPALENLKERIAAGKHPWIGRKHDDSCKVKLSIARKGKPVSENTELAKRAKLRRRIAQISPVTGEIIKIWPYITLAATELDLKTSMLCCAARGGKYLTNRQTWLARNGVYAGYKWQYVDSNSILIPYEQLTSSAKSRPIASYGVSPKRIQQINPETGLVMRVWNGVSEIHKELGFRANRVREAYKGGRTLAGKWKPNNNLYKGFKWQEEGDRRRKKLPLQYYSLSV